MSIWICLYQPKILLLFGLMQSPITFPFSLYQQLVKIDTSSSLSVSLRLSRVMHLLSHLHACVYHPTFFRHLVFSLLSLFLTCPLSLIFSIFNIQPSHMTHCKTNSSYWMHSGVVRDVKTKKQGRRWQWKELKWEKGLCFWFCNIRPYRTKHLFNMENNASNKNE